MKKESEAEGNWPTRVSFSSAVLGQKSRPQIPQDLGNRKLSMCVYHCGDIQLGGANVPS